jgi:hypothetical protein
MLYKDTNAEFSLLHFKSWVARLAIMLPKLVFKALMLFEVLFPDTYNVTAGLVNYCVNYKHEYTNFVVSSRL